MAQIRFGQQAEPYVHRGVENPLLPIANRLIIELERRYREGRTHRQRIGLAGGNPSQLHVDSVLIRWNRRKRRASGKYDKRQLLTVFDGHGCYKRLEFVLPISAMIQEAVIERVLQIWKSRDVVGERSS
jgi:hypothetical protein